MGPKAHSIRFCAAETIVSKLPHYYYFDNVSTLLKKMMSMCMKDYQFCNKDLHSSHTII